MTLAINAVQNPISLPWWGWCKLAGWPILALALYLNHPLAWAIALHWLMDFTLQSHATSIAKAQRQAWPTFCHAFISGGYAGFVVGGLSGLVLSVTIHFIIDYCYKPVYGDSVLTRWMDQIFHIVTLIAIWGMGL